MYHLALSIVVVLLTVTLLVRRAKPICICMSHTENIFSYSKLTEAINRDYAKKHGYDFKIFEMKMQDRAPQWCKVKVIKELLAINKYSYIFWIDADAFFNKMNRKLESIIALDPNKDLYVCDDRPNSGKQNTVNTGTLLVKASDWSKKFANEWYEYHGKFLYEPFHEQSVLDHYINYTDESSHIHVAKTTDFNSCAGCSVESQKNEFIIHLMARSPKYRIDYITKHEPSTTGGEALVS